MKTYDIIVIGAGHAGIEAALAASRMGASVLMLTMGLGTIGHLSCNPAIGGVGKGQLVKEIDALGGEMAKAADACGVQFRILNASKGEAVRSSRAQIDRKLYNDYMTAKITQQSGISVQEAQVASLIVKDAIVLGVVTTQGRQILSKAVVICCGTFLSGLIHVGMQHYPGGRINEPAALGLDTNLRELGFNILRFKTGTCARLDKKTIDFSGLIVQEGDQYPRPFSFSTLKLKQKQIPCHITYTNELTHKIIHDNLDKSPLYAGVIRATGVRYCPSIEDKIVKFSGKTRHQIFLEPEGYDTDQIYPNGISTSLPEEVQLKIIHSIAGLQEAKVMQFGYGIEHSVVEPTQLYPSLETKLIKNLFLAGQINGTTGYEEAAAQGLIAGINAALKIDGGQAFVLDRSTSYIGVLIDDLTTKGTLEPYRMFTSRVEYRLILREDNADLRLRGYAHKLGLVSAKEYKSTQDKQHNIEEAVQFLRKTFLVPSPEINNKLQNIKSAPLRKKTSLEELFKRPEVDFSFLSGLAGGKLDFAKSCGQQLEIEIKYSGFIQRQVNEVEHFKNIEKIKIPLMLDYSRIPGLSREIQEKLKQFKPINLGQASRISGITPAAISLLMIWLKKCE